MAPLSSSQKTASRVSRPAARYRPGKAPIGASIDDYSDSDDSESGRRDAAQTNDDADPAIGVKDLSLGTSALLKGQQRKTAGIVISEGGKKLDLRLNPNARVHGGEEEGSSEYETDSDEEEEKPQAKPVFRKPGAPVPAQQEESGSSEYETDSEEEESASEEEAPKPLLKPLFVPKRARTTIPPTTADNQHPETDPEQQASQQAASERRKEAHDLAAATISRQLAEQRHSETQRSTDVDDTDGLDPEAEFEAWRQRELGRLRRDAEALLSKRKEQAEIEKFKSLPEAEKERLGRERAAQLRAEKKEQRGNPAFMQKYYHKGSFFQDMDILKRDYSEKTTREVDVSQLPKMMQVRNYGVKGRSKWTHLANEDTSKDKMRIEGVDGKAKGCFVCGGPHLKKDCPERAVASGSGSNRAEVAVAVEGSRKWGERSDDRKADRERSRSPRRESSSRDHPSSSKGSRDRHTDEPSHRDKDSRSHRSRDDRKHTSSSSSRRDEHRSHRSRRDHDDEDQDKHRYRSHRHDRDDADRDRDRDRDRHRSRSDGHDSSDRKHKHHDDHDRHKRRDRPDEKDRQHHSSSTSSRRSREERDQGLDRKRSRLDPSW